jgi:hypothetical protein
MSSRKYPHVDELLTCYFLFVVARTAAKPRSGTGARDTVVALLRAADRVRRRAARIVEPHGITLQQYNVLRILESAKEDGIPTLEVAARMIEETPDVTRLLDRLEANATSVGNVVPAIVGSICAGSRVTVHVCWRG